MGLESIVKLLGFDNYYDMDNYNNDDDYYDNWGIWNSKFSPYYSDF
ncbi:MAG: hypothetical protein HRT66_06835 [Flavobacteriaceae bacterium]|nr:hypothetical protein [Flavobacteriaceae bacterium]